MKYILIVLVASLVIFSCKKKESDITSEPFEFISLTASDTFPRINEYTTLTAVTKGSNLTYTWNYQEGVIIGSGSQVQFTICHSAKIDVTCEVSNPAGEVLSKTIRIDVKP